jgi:4-aminobutyrate aminotransferase-like enzyme
LTGPHTNVLKIRPPLTFSSEHVDRLVEVLDVRLAKFELRGGSERRQPSAES